MDLFEKLLKQAERANKEDDLPDNILEQIRSIHANQDKYTDVKNLIDDLVDRLEDYEPFADVGCGNESYSTADIQRGVDKILSIRS